MKDLLDLILQNITTHPDAAKVDTSTDGDVEVFTITVDPEDMGRVIGKDGKVIRAIRSLAHVVAIRQGKRYRVTLNDVDTDQPVEASPEPSQKAKPKAAESSGEDLIAGAIDVGDPSSEADA